MKLPTLTPLAIIFAGLTSIVQADTISKQTDSHHAIFEEKMGALTVTLPDERPLGLSVIERLTTPDKNGVTSNTKERTSNASLNNEQFNFSKVSNHQIYFGEWWNPTSQADNNPSRTMFYIGDSDSRTLPRQDVIYAVRGINNYDGTNLLSGDLTASFSSAAPRLTGSLSSGFLEVSLQANINAADASFKGSAEALNPSNRQVLSSGDTQGHFFVNDTVTALAGFAQFKEKELNTVFGGSVKK